MNIQATPNSGAKTSRKALNVQSKPAVPSVASQIPSVASADATRHDPDLPDTPAFIEPEQRRAMIAEAAYYRAERRGFEPGHDLEDWCLAEGDIDGMLTRG